MHRLSGYLDHWKVLVTVRNTGATPAAGTSLPCAEPGELRVAAEQAMIEVAPVHEKLPGD